MEVDSEARRMDRKSSLADKRKRDAGIDSFSRREANNGFVKGGVTNVGSTLSPSTDANVQNAFSTCPSSKSISDSHPINHTLPGLSSSRT